MVYVARDNGRPHCGALLGVGRTDQRCPASCRLSCSTGTVCGLIRRFANTLFNSCFVSAIADGMVLQRVRRGQVRKQVGVRSLSSDVRAVGSRDPRTQPWSCGTAYATQHHCSGHIGPTPWKTSCVINKSVGVVRHHSNARVCSCHITPCTHLPKTQMYVPRDP
jgi:hypothetical protein